MKRPWIVEVSDGASNPAWQRWGSYSSWIRANEAALRVKGRTRIIHTGNIHKPGNNKEAPHA